MEMLTKKCWAWVLMSGMWLAGCIEPMEAQPGAGSQERTAPRTLDGTTTDGTLPPLMWLDRDSGTDLRKLWPLSGSVHRYAVLIAYSLPPDASGAVPPPRFRAFGVDGDTGSFIFVVDGERRAFLGDFTEAMLMRGVSLISLAQGMLIPGKCNYTPPPSGTTAPLLAAREDGSTVTASAATTGTGEGTDGGSDDGSGGCASDPNGGIATGGSPTGDGWNLNMSWVMNLPFALDPAIGTASFEVLAKRAFEEKLALDRQSAP
jgi:hypothetical protein